MINVISTIRYENYIELNWEFRILSWFRSFGIISILIYV